MGNSSQPILLLKGMVQGNMGRCCKSSWQLAQAKRRHVIRRKRPTRMIKWRVRSRKPVASGIERRVRTLKKLIPNTESRGLDGLFRETADYILSLQMRVKVMQSMVKALSGSDHDE